MSRQNNGHRVSESEGMVWDSISQKPNLNITRAVRILTLSTYINQLFSPTRWSNTCTRRTTWSTWTAVTARHMLVTAIHRSRSCSFYQNKKTKQIFQTNIRWWAKANSRWGSWSQHRGSYPRTWGNMSRWHFLQTSSCNLCPSEPGHLSSGITLRLFLHNLRSRGERPGDAPCQTLHWRIWHHGGGGGPPWQHWHHAWHQSENAPQVGLLDILSQYSFVLQGAWVQKT